jgi:hypothetical protein
MGGLAKALSEEQVLRRVVKKVCEQVWSQNKTINKVYKEVDLADAYKKGWDDAMLRNSLEKNT